MEMQVLNTLGLKCPQPVLKIAIQARKIRPGNILEVLADCPTFERDVRTWCERLGKTSGGGLIMALPLAVEPRSKALPIHSPYPYFLRLGLLGPGVFYPPVVFPHFFHRGLSLS
jgi:tRNA 2-thiouridine synthesizing protein A